MDVKLQSKTMKSKHLFLSIAALVVAGGLWLGGRWTISRAFHKSSIGGDGKMREGGKPGQMLRPPNPNRKFEKLTPEERVQLARRGPIGG
jgi:hypothetical protein